MEADPGLAAGHSDDERRRLRRLVSALRAHGGVGAVATLCHADMPDVDGVVLTVDAAHAGRIILSDSGPHGDQLEDLHAVLGEGPCIDAVVTAVPVMADDLARPHARVNWPRFAEHAPARAIRAVFAHPVLAGDRLIGVLSAYRADAGSLTAAEREQLGRYATAAAVVLLDHTPVHRAGGLDLVLPARAGEVQQAVGVVMELAGVDAPTALHRLRDYARRSARPMQDVVAEVRTCRLPFDPSAVP
ncbi:MULTISPECIES: GAF and ANTAR domain-containing protein [Catenuloplanes]|uniref:GAF domain-containing protein n=1 Tax=Catenuloplanes niger TaxID=587534 RepID=A0AAE4CR40_9ACTN|nr:GAF and ANTAR domain-containing protein [Catenuloplanes niger]MDR7321147.1 GAF domain-containing protein [Catenuloplanes niger]